MANPPQTGSQAPDFSLPSPAGRNIRLGDLRGKWVVVYFYPRDGTQDCVVEAMEFSELLREFQGRECIVLGVSRDSLESHRRFIDQCRLMVPLLSDEGLAAIQAYGAWRPTETHGTETMDVARSTYLVDPRGVVRAAWPEVISAKGHAAEVLETLKGLADGAAGEAKDACA